MPVRGGQCFDDPGCQRTCDKSPVRQHGRTETRLKSPSRMELVLHTINRGLGRKEEHPEIDKFGRSAVVVFSQVSHNASLCVVEE